MLQCFLCVISACSDVANVVHVVDGVLQVLFVYIPHFYGCYYLYPIV